MKAPYYTLLRVLSNWLNAIGAVTLTFMMLLTVLDVCGRYFFRRPIVGAYERPTTVAQIPAAVERVFELPTDESGGDSDPWWRYDLSHVRDAEALVAKMHAMFAKPSENR